MESTRLIFADSRNRDVNLFPDGNSYTLHLSTPVKNVKRVDLVSARVPNTMYNLNTKSNVITTNTSNIALNPGFYSTYGLANAVSVAGTSSYLSLNYLQNEGHFIFSCPVAFTLKINTLEMSNLLGIPYGTTFGSSPVTSFDPFFGPNIFRSNTLVSMTMNEFIFLDIDELKTPSHIDARSLDRNTGTVSGSNINRAFAPIMMDCPSGSMKIYHENSDYTVSVEYPEPINSLQRLTVRWFNANGSLLDFKGYFNHAFILKLHVLENDVRRLPPPPPLQDVEIKRIVEAMTMVPPPPPEEKRKRIPWVLIFLALIGAFIAWKTLAQRAVTA